ncbi:MAG: restriction endonuclease subunit S [Bacteroidales bacterium]|nr:restriction endonuclease subunit S [Bacteroidales bacterium]
MTEWKEYKLGEIAEILDYKRKPLSSMERSTRKGIYPYYGASGIIDSIDDYIFDGEHILISEDGENLRTRQTPIAFLANGKFWVNNHAHILKADYVHSRLICYYFAQLDLNPYITGAVQPKLSQESLNRIPLYLPTLINEREKIVSILSSLDDKIDLLHRENATLEQMAETMFRQWFVVERKEEWEEGKLGDYVIETVGGEWGKENPEGDFTKAVQCIRGTDIADLNVGLASKTPIRFVKESKFEKIEPRNGDIIMEISGGTENQSTGRVAYINEDVKTLFQYPIVFSNFCRLLRVDEKYSYFLYCYLKYLYDQDEYFNLENGSSGIKNLDYKALLYDLTYPMPKDKRLIFEFNDNVSLYFKKINRNKQQIQTLIQTRDGLLPRLMSREIKI